MLHLSQILYQLVHFSFDLMYVYYYNDNEKGY